MPSVPVHPDSRCHARSHASPSSSPPSSSARDDALTPSPSPPNAAAAAAAERAKLHQFASKSHESGSGAACESAASHVTSISYSPAESVAKP